MQKKIPSGGGGLSPALLVPRWMFRAAGLECGRKGARVDDCGVHPLRKNRRKGPARERALEVSLI